MAPGLTRTRVRPVRPSSVCASKRSNKDAGKRRKDSAYATTMARKHKGWCSRHGTPPAEPPRSAMVEQNSKRVPVSRPLAWFYADRTVGGDCDHRHPGGPAPPGFGASQRKSQPGGLQIQHAAGFVDCHHRSEEHTSELQSLRHL